jgi:hypothetical protein
MIGDGGEAKRKSERSDQIPFTELADSKILFPAERLHASV